MKVLCGIVFYRLVVSILSGVIIAETADKMIALLKYNMRILQKVIN